MRLVKKIFILIFILVIVNATVHGFYVESNKDTKRPPESVTVVPLNTDGYTQIQENENFIYYYKKHNGILAVYDKRNNFTWKSGIDHDYDQFIEQTVELFLEQNPNATDEELLALAKPLEDQMNTTREGIGNSMVLIEYLNRENVTRPLVQTGSSTKTFITAPDLSNPGFESVQERVSNSVDTDVLRMVNNDPNHYRLDFKFKAINVDLKVHLYFDLDGYSVEIRDDEIEGDDVDLIGSIAINPFMGSYGGKIVLPEIESETIDTDEGPVTIKEVVWNQVVQKPRNPGYIFVPDGSGALIRFADYSTSLQGYTGNVYGQDIGQLPSHQRTEPNYVPFKEPTMPVFGISYGDGTQAAFLSYTTKGAEYMQIYARPSNSADSYNLTDYMIAHSRYLFNKPYTQVYNQSGASYQSLFKERNHFDIRQHYVLLAGDGSNPENPYAADYVGMALKYRDYLSDASVGILDLERSQDANIPLRVDFLMSDAKKSLIGIEDIVTTNVWQVKVILDELRNMGISNMNSGVLGYQKGGVTLGRKSHPEWVSHIGSKNDFTRIVNELNDLGIDLSIQQEYTTIYEENVFLIGNAMKHIGGWYANQNIRRATGPVSRKYYATPWKVSEWITGTINETNQMGFESYTYTGVTNQLYSHYETSDYVVSVTDSINIYQEAFDRMPDALKINGVTPNMYLWKYMDRHLQTPMFNTQHLIETDTVPFLQMVLNGSMELYATYSNFSFYEQRDILRMVDYNTYPSFILTYDPAYKLVSTNSSDYYSTEYTLYKDLIHDIYLQVNGALASVQQTLWTGRTVLAPGVILNTYENGIKVVINYTDEPFIYQGTTIDALNYRVVI